MDPRPLAHATVLSIDWLVRLPTWLGDTVMALPTLRAVARQHPGRWASWGPAPLADLLAALGLSAPHVSYRRRSGIRGTRDALATVRQLRRLRPRATLLLPNAFEPALLAALAGIPRRLGYATDGRRALLTDPVTPPPLWCRGHEADRFAALLEAAGIATPPSRDPPLDLAPELGERGRELLCEEGPYLGLVPGAANGPAKQWAPERFADVALAAARRWDSVPVLLGSDDDRPVIDAVETAAEVPCSRIVGTGLVDLAAALLRCRAVVSNDTGAAHLAAALGRPTVVAYGPTDPARTLPRGARVAAVEAGAFCQPCEAHLCPLDHRCMKNLDTDSVIRALQDLWPV